MPAFRRHSASANTSMIVSARSFLLVELLSFETYPIAASSFWKARSGLIHKSHIRKFFFPSNLGTLLWTTVVFVILQLKNRGNACRGFHASYAEIRGPILPVRRVLGRWMKCLYKACNSLRSIGQGQLSILNCK